MGGDELLGFGGLFMNYVPGMPLGEGLLFAPFNIYSGIRDAANPYLDPMNRWAGGLNAFGNLVLLTAGGGLKDKPCPPRLEISANKYPDLAENILNAQKAGYPQVLTAGGDAAGNRAAALQGVPIIPGLARDEYPFASSLEGGQGAWVGYIPESQNNAQGGLISRFLIQNNIQAGSQYRVVIVP
jgi:hypothetical protein